MLILHGNTVNYSHVLCFVRFILMKVHSALTCIIGVYECTDSRIRTKISPQWNTSFTSLVFYCIIQWISHTEITGLSSTGLVSGLSLSLPPWAVHFIDDVCKSDRSQRHTSQVLQWSSLVHRN
jgi:hypothetical protein